MSNVEGVISYVFTWHSHVDAKSCQKCLALNGREWRDQDLFQERLYDMFYGDVWDLNADHSLAHGGHQHNCRCQLTVRVERVEIEKLDSWIDFSRYVERML